MAAYLAQVECRQMMRAFARPGSRVPLHCSAVGKTILLSCSVKALSRILHRQGMPRPTVKTIVTPALLRADLERTRAAGHAIDDEEHAIGLRCLAAPITNENGEVIAAVSVSGPMARMTDERNASVTALVVGAARSISRELGGMGSGSSL
nr:IclR family transcriptional regulator C-terminal domain-containing protein [uncultured Lichenicoccus sp.]